MLETHYVTSPTISGLTGFEFATWDSQRTIDNGPSSRNDFWKLFG